MIDANSSVEWAKKTLIHLGYVIEYEPEMVRNMPWSQVIRFYTTQGILYLKTSAAPFANEANLLTFLADIGLEAIPKIIAMNPAKNCFLMKEAGKNLRASLKDKYDVFLPAQALSKYAAMQIQCIPYTKDLLKVGVNDWRLHNLPKLYLHFIQNKALLEEEGLSVVKLQKCHDFYPKFILLCETLSNFGIPETLEHGDFQDNNILIKATQVTIHDFGDASITHPFFSLASFLNSAQRHHGIHEFDERYPVLFKEYMKPWESYLTEEKCIKAFKIAKNIGRFVFALSFARIKSCPGIENFPEYKGYISEALKQLIENTD